MGKNKIRLAFKSNINPNSLLNTYSPKFDKRVFVVRPNSLLTTYSAPQGKRGAALRPNSLLNAYGMKGKRGLSLRPNRFDIQQVAHLQHNQLNLSSFS